MARSLLRFGTLSVVGLLLLGLLAPPASATHAAFTLQTSVERVLYGDGARLSGALTASTDGSPLPNQNVDILDDTDAVVGSDVTDASGAFSLRVSPGRNTSFRARWVDPAIPDDPITSEPVTVLVRPRLSVDLSRVRLFDRARASGRLRPAHPGSQVTVELFRGERVAATGVATVRDDGTFLTRFYLRLPGTYRARVTFAADADHTGARDRSAYRTTPLPSLAQGSSSPFVRLLEQRLLDLRYRVPNPDYGFDFRTGDAVLAFNKVQGRARLRSVDASTWRALARPRRPRARNDAPGRHIEVDKTRQVLLVVNDGRVRWIVHVSTGLYEGWTRDGVFRVFRKVAGYSPNRLYYPSYFDGGRAVHGWPEVPAYPASHGCVRVPNWTAVWLHQLMPLGTVVRVYRS